MCEKDKVDLSDSSALTVSSASPQFLQATNMDAQQAIARLRRGQQVRWPASANSQEFAQSLDTDTSLVNFRNEFIIPSKADLKRGELVDDQARQADDSEASIYLCGNSLGLQPKATSQYLQEYLQTWSTIAVKAHFNQLGNSHLVPFQDMAADCSEKMAKLVGASASEVVAMNTLTVNLHMMMAAFYRPTEKKHKIMLEWRPFPSDWVSVWTLTIT
jgi:kynureninase